jgi:hypothetical protein
MICQISHQVLLGGTKLEEITTHFTTNFVPEGLDTVTFMVSNCNKRPPFYTNISIHHIQDRQSIFNSPFI